MNSQMLSQVKLRGGSVPPMRRAAFLIPLLALSLTGCKKVDELQAELDKTKAQLLDTQGQLESEKQANGELRAEKQTLEQKIAQMEAEIAQLNAQIKDLADKAGLTERELAELRKEKAKREKELNMYKSLFASLKEMIEAGTIDVEFRKGRLVVVLANNILFDSGKTKLKPEGEAALAKLSAALKTVADRDWLVAGNTDNIPINNKRFKNNWELSTARAVRVVSYMIEQGMDPAHTGAAGFAEFDPVGDNKTPEGRATNRRIDIILMPSLGDIPGMKEMLQGARRPNRS
jgi:chemotaxis protein MotB